MAKVAYLDCFSGISGNMLLGALLQAGFAEDNLRAGLASLALPNWELSIRPVQDGGLSALLVEVNSSGATSRNLHDIVAIIQNSSLPELVKEKAEKAFRYLAEAEAQVHGISVDDVHFHEVGAVDAIIDIVGSVYGFYCLGVTNVKCSPLPLSAGWVKCSHGEIPLPAPATMALLSSLKKKVPVYGLDLNMELVTPTGAAIVLAMVDEFGVLPTMNIEMVGYGAGSKQRSDGRPNLLRICLGQMEKVSEKQEVEVITANLDDCNPEIWPHVCNALLQAGALDVSLTPVQMKKGRPGFRLEVICDSANRLSLAAIIFRETTTIGLRYHREQRITLAREMVELQTPWGVIRAKQVETPAGKVIRPEYEECLTLARKHGVPLQDVYRQIAVISGGSNTEDINKI